MLEKELARQRSRTSTGSVRRVGHFRLSEKASGSRASEEHGEWGLRYGSSIRQGQVIFHLGYNWLS